MTENRNDQLIRFLRIIDFLSSSRYGKTIHQVHTHLIECGYTISERTARRDLKALESYFLPLVETKNDEGATQYRLQPNSVFSQQFVMTPKAVMGLWLMRGIASQFKSGPFSSDLPEFFATVDSCLNERARDFFHELTDSIKFSENIQWGQGTDSRIFTTIQKACMEKHLLEAEYESNSSGLRQRKLGPHAIYFDRGTFYLLAEDMESQTIKTFAVPRFKSAAMLDVQFSSSPVDPKLFFQNNFGVFSGGVVESVVIDFDKALAKHAKETIWHPSQQVQDLPGQCVRLTLSVALTPDFVNWVVGFGEHVTVLEPDNLKKKILDIVSSLQKRYASGKAS